MAGNFVLMIQSAYARLFLSGGVQIVDSVEVKRANEAVAVEQRNKACVIRTAVVEAESDDALSPAGVDMVLKHRVTS